MAWTRIQEALFQKVNAEMEDYARGMWDLPGSTVYDRAEEIAAMRFCYDQLVGYLDDWPAEDLAYLLRFRTPLAVLRDQWLAEQSGEPSESLGCVLWELRDKQAAEADYDLDPDWSPEQDTSDGPVMC